MHSELHIIGNRLEFSAARSLSDFGVKA